MIISATGHREIDNVPLCERKIDNYIIENVKIDLMIVGGAEGFDTILGWKCIEHNIAFDMYLPYIGCKYDRELLKRANSYQYVSPEYHKRCFFLRDERMVDDSNGVVAWYDGRNKGGTLYTVNYAKNKKPVVNLYENTMS